MLCQAAGPGGDSAGGTVETWSGEAGNVQLNLSTKTREPGHNNTIMIVETKNNFAFWPQTNRTSGYFFLDVGVELEESGRRIHKVSKKHRGQINWTDGKKNRQSRSLCCPLKIFPSPPPPMKEYECCLLYENANIAKTCVIH